MVRFSKYIGSVRIQLILLKTKNWKYRSKIIFEWVNSVVRPIFNIFFRNKVVVSLVNSALCLMHSMSWAWKVQLLHIHVEKKRKKKKEKNQQGNMKLKTQTRNKPISNGHVVMLIFFNGSCSLSLLPNLKSNFVNFLKLTINKCLKSSH